MASCSMIAPTNSFWTASTSATLRWYCSPQSCSMRIASTSSVLMTRVSPISLIRPVTKARTPSSAAIVRRSRSRSLYANAIPRGTTRRSGNLERLLIRPTVIPSLRYSPSGSSLPFSNGSTAIESIGASLERSSNTAPAMIAATKTRTAMGVISLAGRWSHARLRREAGSGAVLSNFATASVTFWVYASDDSSWWKIA